MQTATYSDLRPLTRFGALDSYTENRAIGSAPRDEPRRPPSVPRDRPHQEHPRGQPFLPTIGLAASLPIYLINFLSSDCFDWRAQIWVSPCTEDVLYWLAKVFQFTAVVHFLRLASGLGLMWRVMIMMLVCQARRRHLFSRTSCFIFRLDLKWLG